MRHLWSLLAGLVAAPLAWVLLALAQDRSASTIGGWEERAAFDTAELIIPAGYLAAAGILLGLIASLRISPLGPVVAGLLLTTVYGLMFINPFRVHDTLPKNLSVLDEPVPLVVPLDNGTLGIIGLLLLMSVFSAQRWRRWPAVYPDAALVEEDEDELDEEDDEDRPVWVPPRRDTAPLPLPHRDTLAIQAPGAAEPETLPLPVLAYEPEEFETLPLRDAAPEPDTAPEPAEPDTVRLAAVTPEPAEPETEQLPAAAATPVEQGVRQATAVRAEPGGEPGAPVAPDVAPSVAPAAAATTATEAPPEPTVPAATGNMTTTDAGGSRPGPKGSPTPAEPNNPPVSPPTEPEDPPAPAERKDALTPPPSGPDDSPTSEPSSEPPGSPALSTTHVKATEPTAADAATPAGLESPADQDGTAAFDKQAAPADTTDNTADDTTDNTPDNTPTTDDGPTPVRRRPLPHPRRATLGDRKAVPSESPWVAPPRPLGPDTTTE